MDGLIDWLIVQEAAATTKTQRLTAAEISSSMAIFSTKVGRVLHEVDFYASVD